MTARTILGSGSSVRCKILEGAGVAFDVVRPSASEEALKESLGTLPPGELALALAEGKALSVPAENDALVIGADQVLDLGGAALDKAPDMVAARARLRAMRGRAHALCGGMVLVRDGQVVWRHQEISRITLRDFSDEFLDWYLETAGDGILSSVACYQFEGLGAQLFERVDGDYFAILGLPLLPLLAALRELGGLKT